MRKTTMLIVSMMLAASLSACGKSGGAGAGAAGETGEAKLAANALADANAAVPAELKAKLKFVEKRHEERKSKLLAIVPDGWKESEVIPGSFAPPSDQDLGFRTRFSIGSNCDGTCEPKDWAATSDKVDFAQFAGGDFKVLSDDKKAGSRVLVASGGDGSMHVRAAFWKDGEARYYTCSATLDRELATAAPAFERACRATTPLW